MDKGYVRWLRDQGMTYQQIGEVCGVSRQRIGQILGKWNPNNFHVITDSCIYPNLRKWMNDNKVSRAEFCRRMGYDAVPGVCLALGRYMNGITDPPQAIYRQDA